MKLKIKVKVLTPGCEPTLIDKGDWIDLKAAKDIKLQKPYANILHRSNGEKVRDLVFSNALIPLGVAMELPKGFEAIVAPRSSSYKHFNFIQCNSIGVIDYSYNGDNDQWKLGVLTFGDCDIKQGDRVCQFRIQPSQKATILQKLKGLLSDGIELVFVDTLGNDNRNGFGSTGIK